jgi:hypothetical protein
MEIRVPVFAGRRILKKESLWDIRDYTYAGWQLYYADHTDGLLKGCEIHAEDGRLVIGKGMLKFHDFIYLLMEEAESAAAGRKISSGRSPAWHRTDTGRSY